MYQPAHFEERRPERLHALMRSHPFGMLVTTRADGIEADGLPFLFDPGRGPHGTLRAHVARANPLWRETRTEMPVLVVFQGPDSYVSPAWYPSKAAGGKVVPTWNYVLVQARGLLRVVDDAAWLRTLVGELTERHEAPRAEPWQVGDAPDDYIARMLEAIVGIEIELSSLTGKWKLSQNRSAADRAGVVAGLREAGGEDATDAMAALVERAAAERSGG